jgi:hypothetical protein
MDPSLPQRHHATRAAPTPVRWLQAPARTMESLMLGASPLQQHRLLPAACDVHPHHSLRCVHRRLAGPTGRREGRERAGREMGPGRLDLPGAREERERAAGDNAERTQLEQ